jgi:hypothetical protein
LKTTKIKTWVLGLEQDLIHIAMTLDATYLRGSVAGVFLVLQHASCPENIVFHFIVAKRGHDDLRRVVTTTFPYLSFRLYHFDSNLVRGMISYSIRRALDPSQLRTHLPRRAPPFRRRSHHLLRLRPDRGGSGRTGVGMGRR